MFTVDNHFWVTAETDADFLRIGFSGLPPVHGGKCAKFEEECLQKALKKVWRHSKMRIVGEYVIRVVAVYPFDYKYTRRRNSSQYLAGVVRVIRDSRFVPFGDETQYEIAISSRVEECAEPYTEVTVTPRKRQ